ncbi:MAG: SPASM domain-containing protein [Clostridia bacterium]|nr:SPASM domain-containing protein [Clostridia bacterium]
MKSVNIMIKPASSACNMRCKYCFYEDVANARAFKNAGRMQNTTVDAMLANMEADLSSGDRVSFAFQGGEPTLAGLEYFKHFVSVTARWKGIKTAYALQTNGILLDDAWCAFLKENNFLVGISCDLLPEMHNATRIDAAGEGTYKQVTNAIALLKKHKVEFNVLCTLTNFVARHPGKVWNQLVKLGIDYVQFTPCIGFMEEFSDYALTPKRFAEFYIDLFGYWYKDYSKGSYRSVKLFDDVVNQLILKVPTGCGLDGKCRAQLVVEGDGSVYPCDFYCVDEYKLGNLAEQRLCDILSSPVIDAFVQRAPASLPALCEACPYKGFCGGNCKRMRKEICIDASGSFCGYKAFLEKCGPTLSALANKQRMYMNRRRG